MRIPTDVAALIDAHAATELSRRYVTRARQLRLIGGRDALRAKMLRRAGVWRRTAAALTECAYA